MRPVALPLVVERLPDLPDFVFAEHTLPRSLACRHGNQMNGVRFDDLGKDAPIEDLAEQGTSSICHDRRAFREPIEECTDVAARNLPGADAPKYGHQVVPDDPDVFAPALLLRLRVPL